MESEAALSSESAAPAPAADVPRNSRRLSQPLAALRRTGFTSGCCASAPLHNNAAWIRGHSLLLTLSSTRTCESGKKQLLAAQRRAGFSSVRCAYAPCN